MWLIGNALIINGGGKLKEVTVELTGYCIEPILNVLHLVPPGGQSIKLGFKDGDEAVIAYDQIREAIKRGDRVIDLTEADFSKTIVRPG